MGICFLFNWIGLFVTFCCSRTVAARYGGLSGFGLSLVKWISLVRFSPEWTRYTQEAAEQNQPFNANAFIYIFLFIGLLFFFKGAFTWVRFRHLQVPVISGNVYNLYKPSSTSSLWLKIFYEFFVFILFQ